MALMRLLIVFLVFLVAACTPTQRPLKNGQGYVVLPAGENHYRIEYYLKYAKLAETYWNITAGQLCPGGFQVLYSKKHVLNFDMYVPIAGNNVNIGRQEFIQYGEVVCEGEPSNAIKLTESQWREFNAETKSIKPVSEKYLTEYLKVYSSHLSTLPVQNARDELVKIWGKPVQQQQHGEDLLSVWRKGGDSWFPNQVILVERNECLKMVLILPGVSTFMASFSEKIKINEGDFAALVASGAVPAYFYRPGQDDCV